jgi:RND family efflux transporter MFP subunit
MSRRISQHAFLVLSLVVVACGGEPREEAAPVTHAHPVEVGRVAAVDTGREFALTGVTRAADRAQLAFRVSGRLAERPVALGDEVDRGDTLARLEQPELRPAVAAARAQTEQLATELAQAERDLKRVRDLHAQEAATQQELESAQSRRDALAASLRRARAETERSERLLAETRLTAPVAGSVEQVYFEPGEFVPAGRPVVGLSGVGALEVEIGLPETLLSEVAVGDAARLTLPLLGGETTGWVTELAAAAPGPGRLFPAVITLDPSPSLRPGVTVAWHLRSTDGERLTVPVAAIASTGGRSQSKVFRVDNGAVRAVPVTLGMVVGERVVIAADLAPGDRVVTLGLDGLVDGRAVEVR